MAQEGDKDAEADARRVAQWGPSAPVTDARQLAQAVLTTVYMGTVNSSQATRRRAARLAQDVGADHLDVSLDTVVDAMAHLFAAITGRTPRFKVPCSVCCSIVSATAPGVLSTQTSTAGDT